MRRSAVVFVLVLVLSVPALLLAGAAGADPANKNTLHITLTCGSGMPPVDAVFELSSSDSFHVVSFSSNFLWKTLHYVTPSGQVGDIDRGIQGGHENQTPVTCTYTGAVSGNSYTVTGFFTP